MASSLDINDPNIAWDKIMVSAANDGETKVFVMAAQRTEKWRDVCIDLMNEYMQDENEDGLKFIYEFYMRAEQSPNERHALIESYIPNDKLKLIDCICKLDRDVIPDLFTSVCKFNSIKLLEILTRCVALNVDVSKHFLVQSVIYNRPSLLMKAITLYEKSLENEKDVDDENIFDVLFIVAVERDYIDCIDILADRLTDKMNILNNAIDIANKMGHVEMGKMCYTIKFGTGFIDMVSSIIENKPTSYKYKS